MAHEKNPKTGTVHIVCDRCLKRIHWAAQFAFSLTEHGKVMDRECFAQAVESREINPDNWSWCE